MCVKIVTFFQASLTKHVASVHGEEEHRAIGPETNTNMDKDLDSRRERPIEREIPQQSEDSSLLPESIGDTSEEYVTLDMETPPQDNVESSAQDRYLDTDGNIYTLACEKDSSQANEFLCEPVLSFSLFDSDVSSMNYDF